MSGFISAVFLFLSLFQKNPPSPFVQVALFSFFFFSSPNAACATYISAFETSRKVTANLCLRCYSTIGLHSG